MYLLLRLEQFSLSLLGPCLLLPREVLVVKFLNLNTRDVNLCGCGNDIGLVHTANRHSIDLERS